MSRTIFMSVGLVCLTALSAQAAPQQAQPFPIAKDGTTNIADCAKVAVSFRNECISHSRPVTGKELYAQAALAKLIAAKQEGIAAVKAAGAAKAAQMAAAKTKFAELKTAKLAAMKVALTKAALPTKAVDSPRGFKIDKDGTTNIADCAKAAPNVRNECISRARPLTGKELAKFVKARAVAIPTTVKTVTAKPVVAVKAVLAAATEPASIPAIGKGFKIAKDGTTDIADCAKANADFRNECISRARPVPGKVIYAGLKAKS